ncbi:MAG: prepilin-type N-terminal cleavage/methylation domain-containing protein [Nitrospirae bacterium]|nr:prepilin-type N-terminal cleavage/methylation domain-containing protein [Candidatus Manganitrophaceae bacterium]
MNNNRGVTLIELVIILVVIAIVASLAVPIYTRYLAKSQQTEAQSNLGAIYVGMLSYSAPLELDGFEGATLDKIAFSTDGMSRYSYSIVNVSVGSFIARAIGISGQVVGDVWEIDETKEIRDLNPDFNQ